MGWLGVINIVLGAFNLVRTSAYRACGGYEALRLTIVDDVKLGLLLQTKEKKRVLMASLDINRPAAMEQLKILGEQAGVAVGGPGNGGVANDIGGGDGWIGHECT